jgi:hypothetical protein
MSTVTLTTGEDGIIYGTLAAAKTYIATKYGDTYAAWRALNANDDDRERTLITATAFIDSQVWDADHDTFAERDALAAFQNASYELAVMILADPTVIAQQDQGSNIKTAYASGAGVEFFNSTTQGAALLPPILMRMIGQYLSGTALGGPVAGGGQSGDCENPFSSCSDYDRKEPF